MVVVFVQGMAESLGAGASEAGSLARGLLMALGRLDRNFERMGTMELLQKMTRMQMPRKVARFGTAASTRAEASIQDPRT